LSFNLILNEQSRFIDDDGAVHMEWAWVSPCFILMMRSLTLFPSYRHLKSRRIGSWSTMAEINFVHNFIHALFSSMS
jgi:hypothetical protein